MPSCVRTCPANARHFGDLADPASAVSVMVAERGGIDLMPEQGTRPVNKYLPPRPRKPLADSAGQLPLAENTDGARGLLRLAGRRAGPDLNGRSAHIIPQTLDAHPLMHPAPSIIVFTTLSGLGYGLAAVLGLGLLDPAALATKLAYLAGAGADRRRAAVLDAASRQSAARLAGAYRNGGRAGCRAKA